MSQILIAISGILQWCSVVPNYDKASLSEQATSTVNKRQKHTLELNSRFGTVLVAIYSTWQHNIGIVSTGKII